MYISRKAAIEALGKLSREPHYQHDGEDYYVGVAEATGEIYSMPSADISFAIKTNALDKEEVWDAIHELSDIRAQYSVFDSEERVKYHACSLAIKALRGVIGE
mgnify:CR=1 FL=1